MASLKQIGKNFYISYYFYDLDGNKKKFKKCLYVSNKREAQKLKIDIEDLIERGIDPISHLPAKDTGPVKSELMRLSQLIDEYLENYNPEKIKNASQLTYNNLKSSLKSVLTGENEPIIKDDPLIKKIDSVYVSDVIFDYLNARYQPAAAHTHASIYKTMFNYAVERKYIDRNPFDTKIKNYPKKPKQGRMRVYDANEIEMMGDYLTGTMRDIVFFALNTGLRRSELFNLKWKDIDWKKQQITVHGKGNKYRTVPVWGEAFDILLIRDDMRKKKFSDIQRRDKWRERKDFVFFDKYTVESINRPFKKMIDELEIPEGNIHDLRHTFATNWIRKGLSAFTLQKVLGHSDIKMTMIYVNMNDKDVENDMKRFVAHAG